MSHPLVARIDTAALARNLGLARRLAGSALSPIGRGGEFPADLSPLPSGERVRVRGRESLPSLFPSRKQACVKGQH